MKNPIDKNATITLDTEETRYFVSREDAQEYANKANLQNWTVNIVNRKMDQNVARRTYALTWKKFK